MSKAHSAVEADTKNPSTKTARHEGNSARASSILQSGQCWAATYNMSRQHDHNMKISLA